MTMSGLEVVALNYLKMRAGGQNSNRFEQLERIRLQTTYSGPISGVLTKFLEMVKCINSNTHKSAVVPKIDSVLRCGAGFATRAVAADDVSTSCSQCPSSFKFTGISTSNPTVRLLRALYFASEREQGAGSRDKMKFASGNLAALTP
jgi:proteasome component ECM29